MATALGNAEIMRRFFEPRAVAVVGASRTPGKAGYQQVLNLREFQGALFAINPSGGQIGDLPCYRDLDQIPVAIDLAIVLLPAAKCVDAVRACVRRDISAVLIPSAGFAEAGEEGGRLQNDLLAAIAGSRTRLIGPNCNGIVNASNKLLASFVALDAVTPGPISIVSQTGIFAAALLNQITQLPGVGIAKVATLGNACDLATEDLLEYFEQDAETGVIALYLEGIRDGLRLARACSRLSLRKPVVALSAGRTDFGRQAVATHTANLASDGKILDDVLRQAGVVLAAEFMDLADLARQFAVAPTVRATSRVMVLSSSGGVGVVAVDHLIEAGLSLARLSPGTLDRLRRLGLGAHELRNPLDIWPAMERLGTAAALRGLIDAIGEDSSIDAIFFVMGAFSGGGTEFDPTLLEALCGRHGKTVACWFYGPIEYQMPWSRALAKVGIPAFTHIRGAVAALAARERLHCHRMRATVASPLERPVPAADLPAQRANLNEVEAKAWLRRYGFQAPESIVLPVHGGTPADGRTIPFPAAVKVLSADLLHKSDVGGVVLDVKDEAELAVAVSDIRAAVSKRGPAVRIEGFLVERMMEGRAEAILSVTRTREFGPVVMLGLGGTLVELLRRATFRLPPVSLPQAEDMIAEIGMRELLAPARAKAAGDIDALAMAIVRLSDAAARADWPFDTLEINPLLVRVKGDGVVALDAVAQPHASRTC